MFWNVQQREGPLWFWRTRVGRNISLINFSTHRGNISKVPEHLSLINLAILRSSGSSGIAEYWRDLVQSCEQITESNIIDTFHRAVVITRVTDWWGAAVWPACITCTPRATDELSYRITSDSFTNSYSKIRRSSGFFEARCSSAIRYWECIEGALLTICRFF